MALPDPVVTITSQEGNDVLQPDSVQRDFDDLDVRLAELQSFVNALLPTGSILLYGGVAAPSGWAFCDGTGGTPDLRGRVPVGAGAGAGLTNRVLGTSGGEETHQLTIPELAQHNHGLGASTAAGGFGFSTNGLIPPNNNTTTTSGTTNNTGSGTGHNNMQPWVALNYIIKL